MPAQPAHVDADRNLLFGVLALQMSFVNRDALFTAMHAWVIEKHKSLGQILLEQQRMSVEQIAAIETLIMQHLQAHGGEAQRSLHAVIDGSTALWSLSAVPDPDVQDGVSKAASQADANATVTYGPLPPSGSRFRRGRFHKGGGLGDVYFAEDTELHREVALKEIKPRYADDLNSRQRFLVEAEITGGLEHPGIVPVYGLGEYKDGRPHYAMRFIRGDSLRDAIERFHAADMPERDPAERSMTLRQLLRRFVDVCNAVAYAHSRGVVHRDIKPANVMLGKFGETLVVDWGLAEAGHEPNAGPAGVAADPVLRPSSGSQRHTFEAGVAVGTIPFMSPEQALGQHQNLGPASDIYSLGSTLYVLLTGQVAYQGKDGSEILAKVQRGQFASPREVNASVSSPLDAICRKAMSFRTEDRYASALELAVDIEHWLADEQVSAYREPWRARSLRWARRHRTAIVAFGVFLVSAVVALSASTIVVVGEQRETERQRVKAVENFTTSRRQNFDIIQLIESSEPELASVPFLHDRRRALLHTAAETCGNLLAQDPNDGELQRHAAQIYRYAANFHRLTNEIADAERYYSESLALRKQLIDQGRDAPLHRLLLAETLRDLGSLRQKQGQLAEAAEQMTASHAIGAELLATNDRHAVYRRSVALGWLNLAGVARHREVPSKTAPEYSHLLDRSIDLLRGLVEGPTEERNPYDPLLLAAALNLKAVLLREADQSVDADLAHREAIKLITTMLTTKSRMVNPADVAHFMAECQIEHCKTLAKIGKPESLARAETNSGVAVNKLFELTKEYPGLPNYRESLAAAFRERGEIRLITKNFTGAREHLLSAVELLEKLTAEFEQLPGPHGELGRSYLGLARVARETGQDDAPAWYAKAAAELREALGLSADNSRYRQDLDATLAERNQSGPTANQLPP